jgi:hypothetical protein
MRTSMKTENKPVAAVTVPVECIDRRIYLIRGQKVMLDRDLAELYGVATKVFNQAVKRNLDRFPADFMFRLTDEEAGALRSQSVTLEMGRGRYSKFAPYAFTEHGVAMLSAVLISKRAVEMSILIVRAFIRLREVLANHKELARRVGDLERQQSVQRSQIAVIYDAVKKLAQPPAKPKRRIGFRPE